ncbi:hypothetical protein ABRZ24_12305 [Brenneria populi]|uniref:Uncharacterized protein n=1 Tax=Brenneria populi TaxID=1505588 RepID=A0ABU6JRJ2_9GAMM|nr:hypothetical protein [Brenneria populi Li et al. 2015]
MKLFHGSYSNAAPVITLRSILPNGGDNIFEGLFASADADIAKSHGDFVYCYNVDKIADNSDLNARIEDVIEYLRREVETDGEELEALAYAIADDECDDLFSHLITPRDAYETHSWEMQRLRGRVAAYLGFDAVEMDDEHGTSYLIVNPEILAE